MTVPRILLAAALAAAAGSGALAQNVNRPPDKYGAPIPAPEQQAQSPDGGAISSIPAHSSGVLKPPATGDRNVQMPPETGDRPAIVPPGMPPVPAK